MKIVNLTAENIKRLVAVDITPDANIVTIAGKNGAGKTSVLDSIWWALAGTSHIQSQPIRKGQSTARIRLDMGELIVERKFNEKGSTLTVQTVEGARFPSPQGILDALLGELSFDPLAFSRMPPKQQFDELRRVADIDIDCAALDRQNAQDYTMRTDINRQAKAKRAQAEGIAFNDVIASTVPPDESALVAQLEEAGKTNQAIDARRSKRDLARLEVERWRQQVDVNNEQIVKLQQQIDRLKTESKDLTSKAKSIEKQIEDAGDLPREVDTAAIRSAITNARNIASEIEEHQRRRTSKEVLLAETIALEDGARALTVAMERRDAQRIDAIKAAKLPIAGLGLGNGVVTFNDVPLEQTSSAEQLRISLAIAMASNPKLRVIRIQDGSLLDDDSLASITAAAIEHDYQIWIERVDTSGKIGVVIEDGAVKVTS